MKTIQSLIQSNICLMPWINISFDPNGEYSSCCLIHDYPQKLLTDQNNIVLNVVDNSIDEARNSHTLKKMRKDFLDGKKPNFCRKCWNLEEINRESKRIGKIKSYYNLTNDIFKYTKPDGEIQIDKFPLIFCDLKFGNLCNGKCLTCGPYNSSMFGTTFEWMNNNRIVNDLKNNAEHFKELFITGGEPFINRYHWELIDYLISKDLAKNIYLRYNTNGSVMKEEFVNKWMGFRRVKIFFSIDGINETFEKIRTPLKWDKVKNNINLFDELVNNHQNIKSFLSPTVSKYNVFHIPELINWFNNQNFKNIDKEIILNFVYNPHHCAIFNNISFDEVFQLYKPHLNSFYGYYYRTILQLIDKEKYESIK